MTFPRTRPRRALRIIHAPRAALAIVHVPEPWCPSCHGTGHWDDGETCTCWNPDARPRIIIPLPTRKAPAMARMFTTGQRIIVPNPNDRDPAATMEAVVISSNANTTHYQTDSGKGWVYTSRVKAAQTGEHE